MGARARRPCLSGCRRDAEPRSGYCIRCELAGFRAEREPDLAAPEPERPPAPVRRSASLEKLEAYSLCPLFGRHQ